MDSILAIAIQILSLITGILTLVKAIIDIKKDKKSNRHLNFGEFNGYL